MLNMTSSWTSSIMDEKKLKMADLLQFDLVGEITSKVFCVSCSNLLCTVQTNSIMGEKKFKMARFIAIFTPRPEGVNNVQRWASG